MVFRFGVGVEGLRFSVEGSSVAALRPPVAGRESELFIDNLLVRIHFIIVMIRWTGLAPWEFESPCSR